MKMMLKSSTVLAMVALLAVASLTACKNPAEGVQEAKVTEPSANGTEVNGEASNGTAFAINVPPSKVEWVGSKVTGSHDGGFNVFSGTITMSGDDPTTASVEIDIDTTSLYSDDDRLTGHLNSPDFFDTANHPVSQFVSTSISPKEGDVYEVTGNLSLHGVTKQISFDATIIAAGNTVTSQAEFFINRRDFDINYAGKPNDLIRDEVVIKFDLIASAA